VKIGIIGAGSVGAATAFLLATCGLCEEIVLVNRTLARAKAEALDISHSLARGSRCVVSSGGFDALAGSDVVAVTCGVRREEADSDRMDLLGENVKVCAKAVAEAVKFTRNAIFIVVSNPVDVLSAVTLRISGLAAERVIGSGTILDSARFADILAKYFGVSAADVEADVFGEHGNSQVPIWSGVRICGIAVGDFAVAKNIAFTDDARNLIGDRTRHVADGIIRGKGATCYGIAGSVVKICQCIGGSSVINRSGQKIGNAAETALNVSTLHRNFEGIGDVFLSTATAIDAGGVSRLFPLKIDQSERLAITKSAELIAEKFEFAEEILQSL
jgi:L-lactate dehydrogenase